MIPVLIDGPVVEPVSLSEAKLWLRADNAEEDDLIRGLIVASRLMVEAEIGQVLIGQNWRLVGDVWPAGELIPVRVGRVISVSGGRVFSSEGVPTEIAANRFSIFPNSDPPSVMALDRPMPGRAHAGIEIDLRLGFGEAATDVPETIRLAIRRLVALWFEDRDDAASHDIGVPPQIRTLLRPFRRIRI